MMIFSRIVAFLGISSVILVMAQPHNHHHRHQDRHKPIEARDANSKARNNAGVVTVYELNGHKISADEVETCLKELRCVIVGNTLSSKTDSQSAAQPSKISTTTEEHTVPLNTNPSSAYDTPDSSDSSDQPASFVSPAPPAPAPVQVVTPSNITFSDLNNNIFHDTQNDNLDAVNSNFPSGQVDCSQFPSEYGAVSADWVGLGGWTGVQKTPGYSLAAKVINYIQTAAAGEGCTPGSFCSYACPAGYQKSQWPAAQGTTGQSIGGLYCNKNGKLELSRTASRQLCTPGVGNIHVKNLHVKNVAICRTDYPGTEAETVPLNALPGSTVRVTCPDAKEYYRTWEGAPTSAQYYINPSGYDVKDACNWGTPGSNIGNWAPVNMGVGKGDSGSTFVSLFPNSPTNPNGVLDFKIDIKGDVNGHCSYRNGKYYKDGVVSPTGCTVGVNGLAVFELS